MKVERQDIQFGEKFYLREVIKGLLLTIAHFFTLKKHTMQYPEETYTFPEAFRGAPSLVKDQDGRLKCVACFMCQYICPAQAIKIEAEELEGSVVEKQPKTFEIDMTRCIFCGFCEEACPEQAIFLSKEYELAEATREGLQFDKERLLAVGGIRYDKIKKWERKTG